MCATHCAFHFVVMFAHPGRWEGTQDTPAAREKFLTEHVRGDERRSECEKYLAAFTYWSNCGLPEDATEREVEAWKLCKVQ